LPGISFSKIDVDAQPVYQPARKPITQINIDEGKRIGSPENISANPF